MARAAQVVHNPFGLTDDWRSGEARQHLLDKLGRSKDSVIVGFIGNMTWQKRPLVFLDAANQIQEALGNRVIFPMFGELRAGVSDAVSDRIEALDLSQNVLLMGMQLPIEPWIAACDVLIAPAVNEGFGRVLVEAMLAGTPVVAADHGGHREVLHHGKTGFLVAPDDPAAFAGQVLSLLDQPALATTVAQAACKHAQECFSIEKHASKITRIYDSILGGEASTP
jgi:glycosyltransferase involved in cell wall biosynthesis